VTNNIKEITEELLKTRYSVSIGGEGGTPWEDARDILEHGPITRIEIRSGAEIDSIQVYYGGLPGQKHGGGGGGEGVFELKPGYVIDRIQTRAGSRVDKLRFVARRPGSDEDPQLSQEFGRDGGHPFEIVAPDGLALRSISGRAGKRVDKLTFNFGYLARIENVQVDPAAFAQSIKDPQLEVLDQMTFDNPSDVTVTQTFRNSATSTTRTTTNWGGTTRFLFGQSVTAKVTVGAAEFGASAKFEFEQSFNYGQSTERSESKTLEWAINFACPPMKRTQCTVTVFEKKVEDVPFTYDIVLYDIEEGVEIEKGRFKQSATFSGNIKSRNLIATSTVEDIPAGHLQKLAAAASGGA
jgi:hypothetical protein